LDLLRAVPKAKREYADCYCGSHTPMHILAIADFGDGRIRNGDDFGFIVDEFDGVALNGPA
jgi:hypothetical protein